MDKKMIFDYIYNSYYRYNYKMIADILTIVINYASNNKLLKLRLVNKKLKLLVYKYGKLKIEIKNYIKIVNRDKCYYVTKICKKCKLCIWYCHIDENVIKKYKNNIYNIAILDNYNSITDSCIKYLKNLVKLNVGIHNKITDLSIKKLKNLTSLNLSCNSTITDVGIKNLINLTSLDLSDNKNITDLSIKNLINLTDLNLSSNEIITDFGIKGLKYLTSLNLSHNKNITYAGIKDLKKIVILDIRESLIKEDDIKDLINKHKYFDLDI